MELKFTHMLHLESGRNSSFSLQIVLKRGSR